MYYNLYQIFSINNIICKFILECGISCTIREFIFKFKIFHNFDSNSMKLNNFVYYCTSTTIEDVLQASYTRVIVQPGYPSGQYSTRMTMVTVLCVCVCQAGLMVIPRNILSRRRFPSGGKAPEKLREKRTR